MDATTQSTIDRLIIAGGSGFLGQGLIRHLADRVRDVVVLTRGPARQAGRVRYVNWDARTPGHWAGELDGASAIVNFVGRTVDCRKTAANKADILNSRVNSVVAIGQAMRACAKPPPVWIQSATAHIYGDTDHEFLDESSPIGSGFAPRVGLAWEAALAEQAPPGIRTVTMRISFVLGRDGGALQTLVRLTRFGLGGAAGSGRQFISWIHETDLHRITERAIAMPTMSGTYVVTAPDPATNRDFMKALRRIVHRPWSPPVPGLVVRFGAFFLGSDPELALLGRRCVPTRLTREGFAFEYPTLNESLADLLKSGPGSPSAPLANSVGIS
jgi:uncharacterized protein (TIGR01777 family)